jgi:DNA invertase Pin-like site-specific DNA recombinase
VAPQRPVAYSYVRFSRPGQAKGAPLRRQTAAAAAWCARHGITLDTATTLHDLGKSAFTGAHRKNPDRHALAAFLKLVEAGKVPRGSYLVVENLDRLSREDIEPALLLVLNLMQAGVRVVQLKPVEMVFDDKSGTMPVMMMILELSRVHSESAIKSERCSGAWEEKRRRARAGEAQKATGYMGEGCRVITRRLPAWVEERDGECVLIPERADVVKRSFALAIAGYGQRSILKRLTKEGVPAFGGREKYVDDDGRERVRAAAGEVLGAGYWTRRAVNRILADRRALGEFQPRRRDGSPAGDPIPNYYPAVVTAQEYEAARAGAAERKRKPGRVGHQVVNVFAGLLKNARRGDSYYLATRRNKPTASGPGAPVRVLMNVPQTEGQTRAYSFPFDPFEEAVLKLLHEVDPREVTDSNDEPDEAKTLAGQLESVEASIALVVAEIDEHGESPAQIKRLRAKEDEKRVIAEKLAQERRKAAHPLSEAWGQAHNLFSAVRSAPDPEDARLRLRSVLRRIVEEIRLLVVPRKQDRLAALQVFFAGGGSRSYLIFHRPAHCSSGVRREAKWLAKSLPPDLAPKGLDLRDPQHAADLASVLERIDLGLLAKALEAR